MSVALAAAPAAPRPVAADTMAIAGFTVFAKLAGAAKTVFSARCFGSGADLDAYLLAFLVPSFLAGVLSGALNPALVPVLVQARETGTSDFTRLLASVRANRVLLPLSLAGLVLNIALDWILMTRYGVAGIALSAAAVQAFLLAAVAFVVFRRLAAPDLNKKETRMLRPPLRPPC